MAFLRFRLDHLDPELPPRHPHVVIFGQLARRKPLQVLDRLGIKQDR
jgi:hypothetical protein